MALQERTSFLLFFVSLWHCGFSFKCEKLDSQLQQLCSITSTGYNFTASFDSVNGVRYQQNVYSKVSRLQYLMKTCSNVTRVMICSSLVPKCLEGRVTPVLPCREVCEEFVEKCEKKLADNNLKLLYSTLCPVLPGKLDSSECIMPKGFEREQHVKKIGISLSCPTQTIPACHHGNYSSLPEDIKVRLTKHLGHKSVSLRRSACFEQQKRYFCYEQTTPCYFLGKVPYRPCRSFCQRLKQECESEIRILNLSFPLCEELTERERVGDLCRMDSWPVPWPNITQKIKAKKPLLTCYCDTCGEIKRTCQTNGSCFIQSKLNNHGLVYTQQTCLKPGRAKDFICNNTKDYPYAKCCVQNYCNKGLQRVSHVSITTANPTKVPVTVMSNITTTEAKKPLLNCYCDTCGEIKRTCQTNRSCFIQSKLNNHGLVYTQQTCLKPGRAMDFICNNTKDYPYAKCCVHDFCNKGLQRVSQVSITTANPTKVPVTVMSNITTTEAKKPLLTCYCDTCGEIKRTCQTNGSCFIQSKLNNHGLVYTQQTCLKPGKAMDFICNNTKDYPYAKCCAQNYCNKGLQRVSQVSTAAANPTNVPVTVMSNITTTVKSTSWQATTNYTSTEEATPMNIMATTKNSSCTSIMYDSIYTITIKGSMMFALTTILQP